MSETFDVLVNLSPYFGLEEGESWIKALKERAEHEGLKFFLALPFDILNAVASAPAPSFLVMGAKGMNSVHPGSFTEAIAGRLLSSLGCSFVLLGTRRARKEGESNETIREKLIKAKEAGLTPILCVGETMEERQQEQTAEVLTRQVGEATIGLDAGELSGLKVVYEAPWVHEAYSRPEDQEIDHAYQFCRDLIHSLFGEPLASSVRVYCPVPADLKEVQGFIHTLEADGFYFCDPHQLTAVDETALKAKASTARKVREAEETMATAVGEPVQEVVAKQAKQAEEIVDEALVGEQATTQPTEVEAEDVSTVPEAEEMAPTEVETEEAEAQPEAEEMALTAIEGEEAAAQPEAEEMVHAEVETEEVPETKEMMGEAPGIEEEVPVEAEAIPVEEAIPEEKPEEKPRDVKVSNISGTVAKARKPRKKKTEE